MWSLNPSSSPSDETRGEEGAGVSPGVRSCVSLLPGREAWFLTPQGAA